MSTKQFAVVDGTIRLVTRAFKVLELVYSDGCYQVKRNGVLIPISLKDIGLQFTFVYDDHYGSVFGWLQTPKGQLLYIGFRKDGRITLIKERKELEPDQKLLLPEGHPFLDCIQVLIPIESLMVAK